ncbi:MAG TPA: class I SAM-dependent methyltransferase [Kofleriaceae bacterium]|nr:class I SAM-dependent methyltransferase [Kofleriaceae bacterium]
MRSPAAALLLAAAAAAAACSGRADGTEDRARALAARDDAADQRAYDHWRRPDLLIPALALQPGARVADVGAGTGYLEPHLAAAIGPGGRLVATDIDAAALDHLRERARAAGIAVDVRQVAADQPGLEPGGYDLILLAEVDHLLPDAAAYLRRLVPALAPGGRIALVNRVDREAGARRAAAAAGLREVAGSRALPSQFVAVYTPGGDR